MHRIETARTGGECHPLAHELRECSFIAMLELAPTAFGEMPAYGFNVMVATIHASVEKHPVAGRSQWDVLAICGYAVAQCGNAFNCLKFTHRKAL